MKNYLRSWLIAAVFALPIAPAAAHQADLAWTAPNQYNDNTTTLPLSDITGFDIYQSDIAVPGSPNGQLVASAPAPTSAAVTYVWNSTTVTPGLHTFVVVTKTKNGSVSAPSNVLTLTIPNLAAKQITDFRGNVVN